MISLATNPRQIVLIYNSEQKSHREIFAYAKSADKDLLAIDISKEKVAGTVWTEVADLLDKRAMDLIHTTHSSFIKKYGENHELDCNGAIKMLQKDPEMLIYPYAIQDRRAKEIKLYNEMLSFFDPDTAEINIP
ncbi:hypothetical protein LX97_02939 [Nonlabens dokdonensis]|jgi:arsenate reductase-like glutaredoxin family protein|uniref:Uncharacterized protein n=2 Tax=Nonlabens dokdonensis TaxID=328515 RepID=L7WDV9_NONDD|nr:hypothetical protein [Nonlabens dokdonensis]AGC78269.1 hypothetical protein DDD_3142 [Nonlabens dokdonensis DSW-6]PZX37844.1 hypothetical protein LX97_02939 [Nonlabens dokdonensis]